jgi:hypothetical protein
MKHMKDVKAGSARRTLSAEALRPSILFPPSSLQVLRCARLSLVSLVICKEVTM